MSFKSKKQKWKNEGLEDPDCPSSEGQFMKEEGG
jgi:hypothetical protein